jgi:hypothetical protein
VIDADRVTRGRHPTRKTIDLEGRIVKDGVRKALRDRQLAPAELVHAIQHYRKVADSKPQLPCGLRINASSGQISAAKAWLAPSKAIASTLIPS